MIKPNEPTTIFTDEIRQEDIKWVQEIYHYIKIVSNNPEPLKSGGPGSIYSNINIFLRKRKLGFLKTSKLSKELIEYIKP